MKINFNSNFKTFNNSRDKRNRKSQIIQNIKVIKILPAKKDDQNRILLLIQIKEAGILKGLPILRETDVNWMRASYYVKHRNCIQINYWIRSENSILTLIIISIRKFQCLTVWKLLIIKWNTIMKWIMIQNINSMNTVKQEHLVKDRNKFKVNINNHNHLSILMKAPYHAQT